MLLAVPEILPFTVRVPVPPLLKFSVLELPVMPPLITVSEPPLNVTPMERLAVVTLERVSALVLLLAALLVKMPPLVVEKLMLRLLVSPEPR